MYIWLPVFTTITHTQDLQCRYSPSYTGDHLRIESDILCSVPLVLFILPNNQKIYWIAIIISLLAMSTYIRRIEDWVQSRQMMWYTKQRVHRRKDWWSRPSDWRTSICSGGDFLPRGASVNSVSYAQPIKWHIVLCMHTWLYALLYTIYSCYKTVPEQLWAQPTYMYLRAISHIHQQYHHCHSILSNRPVFKICCSTTLSLLCPTFLL